MVSARARTGELNSLALLRAELQAGGAVLTDLTDSNPTRHGLLLPEVGEALARAAARTREYQPDPRGLPAAREALAAHFGGSPADYWLTASTSEAYSWLFALLCDPGEAVAIPSPGYPLIEPIARLCGIRAVSYPLHYVPGGWLLDVPRLRETAGGSAVRAAVSVFPGNPTGAFLELPDVGKPQICDEVFAAFGLDGEAPPIPQADFHLNGLSKLLCAPHLKLGWIHAPGLPPGPQSALDTIADSFLSVNQLAAAALAELLQLVPKSVENTRVRLRVNLATAGELFGEPFRVRSCAGGWTALIEAPEPPPLPELMRKWGLFAHPGWFYDLPDTVLAISLLPEPDQFRAGMERLRAALA
ncbi:MAG: pyridoxal phosphate-dependent aminotransferase [Propionibacteriaceae bacterium]|nr:pyridoxal phosphate-dependent aminotransferase [Propionibacteriaceae bacterium]